MASPTDVPWEECALFDGDVTKCNAINITRKILGSLSLIGSAFMIFLILIFKRYDLFLQRLILYLAVTALFVSVSRLLDYPVEETSICTFEAWWTMFWLWANLLWVSCIAFNLYLIIVRSATTTGWVEIIYHAVTWGISLVMASVPLHGEHYGPAGAWCWIKIEYPLWRLFTWYLPLVLLTAFILVVHAYIHFRLRQRIESWQGTFDPTDVRRRELLQNEIKTLRAYPLVYLILSILPIINRIQNAIAPNHPIFALYLLHAMTSPLYGFVNAIVYGLDPETRLRLTWPHIMTAFQSLVSKRAQIKEFPAEQETPDARVTSISQQVEMEKSADDI